MMKRKNLVQRLVAVNQSSRFLKRALSIALLGAAALRPLVSIMAPRMIPGRSALLMRAAT
jgi:hypothetical protein